MKYDFSNIEELNNNNLSEDDDFSLNKIFVTLNKSIPNEKIVNCKLRIKELIKFLKSEFGLMNKPNQIRQFEVISNPQKRQTENNKFIQNIKQNLYDKYFFSWKKA